MEVPKSPNILWLNKCPITDSVRRHKQNSNIFPIKLENLIHLTLVTKNVRVFTTHILTSWALLTKITLHTGWGRYFHDNHVKSKDYSFSSRQQLYKNKKIEIFQLVLYLKISTEKNKWVRLSCSSLFHPTVILLKFFP